MKLGIKQKLILSFLGASLLPLVTVSYYSYNKAKDSLSESSIKQVESERQSKKLSLETYFKNIGQQLILMTHDEAIVEAVGQFTAGMKSYIKDAKYGKSQVDAARGRVQSFYQGEFSTEYAKQNAGKPRPADQVLSKLTDEQVVLQAAYIADNMNPVGQKQNFEVAKEATAYNEAHARFHTKLKEYQEKFGFYDIYLIDAQSGNVVYSVSKHIDFGTSLKEGPFAESSLAVAFREAAKLGDVDQIVMGDYESYLPSYDSPAGFIATPLFKDEAMVGVIAFQISFEAINKITLQKLSEYDSIETFLVGPDFKMRSDATADKENRNVRSSFRNPDKGSIKNDDIVKALAGETKLVLAQDYLGRDVVAAFGPFDVNGHRWALNTIVKQEEAFQKIAQMRWALLLGTLIVSAIVSALALLFARGLAQQLITLAEGLKTGAGSVAQTSQQIADVSSRLSEASTEQAASLQETVASIDEISAMVQRNADSAASSSKASDASTLAAQRGKEKVEQMISSINDISHGNEDIMSSIQKSNQEISEIVHVIQAIADKTKVINDIVFQTKLLSFNASVEAARAGEHGKGFAVVAEEVGNLASMSGKAATDISNMLDESVRKVTQIVEGTKGMMDGLLKSSKEKVDFGTRTARECAGALDEITRNVSSVNEMVKEISTASKEQSAGVREITKAMSELDQVTQTNTASSNDASLTARDLQGQAEKLNDFVLELASLVYGDPKIPAQEKLPAGPEAQARVVKLEQFRSSRPPKNEKKVVGLELHAPSSNDDRFEDV